MTPNYIHATSRLAAGAALLVLVLGGCGRQPEPAEPAVPAPDASETPAAPAIEVPPPDAVEPAPSPAPEASPPTEPSAVPPPTADGSPRLESMQVATPSAKMSVPVDLRYQFDSAPLPEQPVTLHLAAVPRVAGARLHVSVKQVDGLRVASGSLGVQKVAAAEVYRQQMSVTRSATGPEKLRILVTMEVPEGTAFGYFTVPLTGGIPSQKQESVKQR
jgi:hypothetical protein